MMVFFNFQRNSTVETLILESNELGGYGAKCIADAITRNEYLTEIVSHYHRHQALSIVFLYTLNIK